MKNILSLIDTLEVKEVQEEPVSEKKCMFTNDNYTDEDRMILCEDCKEKCEYSKKEEPANEELEKEEFIDTEEIINEIDPEHKVCTITDLEEAAMEYFKQTLYNGNDSKMQAFKAGAQWQKEKEYTCYEEAFEDGAKWKVENLWKPADGDDLPEIDREVIVLTQPYPLENSEYAVSFAHRPNPDGWDGIVTGKTEHYTPKTYGKGGWNIPDIVYWLDVKLPKDIEL